MSLSQASAYCGTTDQSGECQMQILKSAGLMPEHHLLEIGCGCLNGSQFFINYLEPGHYVGIEPNAWLLEAGISEAEIVPGKRPRFLVRDDFDAKLTGSSFDFIFSHSVLSHAAHWQLAKYFCACRRLLRPHGKGIASLRLAEGNEFGSRGTPDKKDSYDFDWQYPGNSWFTFGTVKAMALLYGFYAYHVPEWTRDYVSQCPLECHDWICFHFLEWKGPQ